MTENVEVTLASRHQLTSRADVQLVIRNLLDSSCFKTILLAGTASGETSAVRPIHNTVGLLQLGRLVEMFTGTSKRKGSKAWVFWIGLWLSTP